MVIFCDFCMTFYVWKMMWMYLRKVKGKKLRKFFFGWQLEDPLVRGMDPRIRIRIRTKISWIRNTGFISASVTFLCLPRVYRTFTYAIIEIWWNKHILFIYLHIRWSVSQSISCWYKASVPLLVFPTAL